MKKPKSSSIQDIRVVLFEGGLPPPSPLSSNSSMLFFICDHVFCNDFVVRPGKSIFCQSMGLPPSRSCAMMRRRSWYCTGKVRGKKKERTSYVLISTASKKVDSPWLPESTAGLWADEPRTRLKSPWWYKISKKEKEKNLKM